jgi:predicted amidohydrolase
MSAVRVASAFVNQTPLDWTGNQERLRLVLEAAREQGAAFLCLPELAITGYGCEDLFLSQDFRRRAWNSLQLLLPETRGLVTVLGLPLEVEGEVYNAVAVCGDGKLLGLVPKQNLARDGVHYEPRWFKAWKPGRVTTLRGSAVGDRMGRGASRPEPPGPWCELNLLPGSQPFPFRQDQGAPGPSAGSPTPLPLLQPHGQRERPHRL